MSLLRIERAEWIADFRVRLHLTNGVIVERDLAAIIRGGVFEPLRKDPRRFRAFDILGGTLAWPNGADLDPDVLIWGGVPPVSKRVKPPKVLAVQAQPTPAQRGGKKRAS